MRKITIVWTITLLIIVGGLTVIGLKIKNDNKSNFMEDELIKQTEKYMGLYPNLYPTLGNKVTLTSERLKEEGYNAKLEEDCTGYVVVENGNTGFKYNAFIKCPDYTTKGYSEE